MDSDSDMEQPAQAALGSDMPFFLPFILGFLAGRRNPDEYGIVVVNRARGELIVIEGRGSGGDRDVGGTFSMEEFVRLVSEMESGKKGPPPASAASVEAMSTVTAEAGAECAICLEGLEGSAKEMPCEHRYHKECVEKWLAMHGTCPVCRYKMPEEEEEVGPEKKGEEMDVEEEGVTQREEVWVSFDDDPMNSSEDSLQSNSAQQ